MKFVLYDCDEIGYYFTRLQLYERVLYKNLSEFAYGFYSTHMLVNYCTSACVLAFDCTSAHVQFLFHSFVSE